MTTVPIVDGRKPKNCMAQVSWDIKLTKDHDSNGCNAPLPRDSQSDMTPVVSGITLTSTKFDHREPIRVSTVSEELPQRRQDPFLYTVPRVVTTLVPF